MSAAIYLVGIDTKLLSERLPQSMDFWSRIDRADIQDAIRSNKISAETMDYLFYKIFHDVDKEKAREVGLESPYVDQARHIKDTYCEDYEYFTFALGIIPGLKEKIRNSPCELFYWTYSF